MALSILLGTYLPTCHELQVQHDDIIFWGGGERRVKDEAAVLSVTYVRYCVFSLAGLVGLTVTGATAYCKNDDGTSEFCAAMGLGNPASNTTSLLV